jgi:hypothetical protein
MMDKEALLSARARLVRSQVALEGDTSFRTLDGGAQYLRMLDDELVRLDRLLLIIQETKDAS